MDIKNIPSPSFVLEEEKLIQNLEHIAEVQRAADIHIILALKAFAMWPVFPLVYKYLSGATASSLAEARLIYEEMGCKAHTYSPAYLPEEFDDLLRYSSHITFNSLNQYHRFIEQVHNSQEKVSPGLRVNPEYSEVETDLYNPASPVGRLGETLPNLAGGLPEGIEGLHFHTLCESSSYTFERTLAVFEEKFSPFFAQLKWVNFGGGHLMTRADYDRPHLIRVLQGFRERHPHLQVIMEPGSAIAWQTGFLLTRVLDIVENHGVKTALLDVSFTAHMPDTLEMPYRPAVRGGSEPQAGNPTYRLGGVSCLAGDYMTEYSFDHELRIGERLILEDMIHYTMVKTTMFNGVKHPNICVLKGNGQLEVIRQFGYEDFKGRLG
ncbi:MAG: carboxynorspermidine decarboxylase [Saprospiraceae bacterium]